MQFSFKDFNRLEKSHNDDITFSSFSAICNFFVKPTNLRKYKLDFINNKMGLL